MLPKDVAAKIAKLTAMTAERGASPAEAATAALLARRLAQRHLARPAALAPGVHVHVVSRVAAAYR